MTPVKDVMTTNVISFREDTPVDEIAERGLTVVHSFDDWDIIHGQGTAAREVLQDDGDIGTIATPVGGGGLLSGTALAARAWGRDVRVIGVEPEVADDARRTLRTGAIQRLDHAPDTIADGVRLLSIGRRNFEVMVERGLVDDIVTVTESELRETVRRAWLELKLAIEPSGALPLAAFLAGRIPSGGRPVGLVLSGGNASLDLVATLLRA